MSYFPNPDRWPQVQIESGKHLLVIRFDRESAMEAIKYVNAIWDMSVINNGTLGGKFGDLSLSLSEVSLLIFQIRAQVKP